MTTRMLWSTTAFVVSLILPATLVAQAPADATAKCKDGSYTNTTSHRGACRGHNGVAEWLTPTGAAKGKPAKTGDSVPGPAANPSGAAAAHATAKCKDGSSWTNPAHRGACKGHGGVDKWLGDTTPPPSARSAPEPKAAVPGNAPADATALCKDGTYSHAQHHRGACARHKGVQQWLKDVPK
jgi:hypothetical protein